MHMGTLVAAQDTEGIVHPPSSTAPLGQHWDTAGTPQPSLKLQDVVRIQPAPGSLPGMGTPHIMQSFAQMELGMAQGAGLSKWPGPYKVSPVQWGSPVAPPGWGRASPCLQTGMKLPRAGAARVSQASAARFVFQ